jgi:ubiquinone/menaquinone biosynthesis C-methylase UbiE
VNSEGKVNSLLEKAAKNARKDRLQQAAQNLFQARLIAKKTQDKRLIEQVDAQAKEIFGKHRCMTETQSIEMKALATNDFILDIGGGGEGIIGKLNGRQVIAIDTSAEELQETKNDALKVVMDATDLKFLPESFAVCTAFFSMMYLPKETHLKVFRQVYRVLKTDGKFLLWDVKIPERQKNLRVYVVRLKIKLRDQEVETGYGAIWDKTQDLEHFKRLAESTGFRVMGEWNNGTIFFLEMKKLS